MAFWSSEKLEREIESGKLIKPYDPEAIKHGAYELKLGSEAFITSFDKGVKQTFAKGEQLCVPSGQFGLLVTEESVRVPLNAIALISIRANVKFQGLVNISGFHVDPGYEGQLKFSVYNAGSQAIVLDVGQRIFMIWYADLDGVTKDGYDGSRGKESGISSTDVKSIQGDIASPGSLKIAFDKLEQDYLKRMTSLEREVLLYRGVMVSLLIAGILILANSFLGKSSSPSPVPTQNVFLQVPPTPSATSKSNSIRGEQDGNRNTSIRP